MEDSVQGPDVESVVRHHHGGECSQPARWMQSAGSSCILAADTGAGRHTPSIPCSFACGVPSRAMLEKVGVAVERKRSPFGDPVHASRLSHALTRAELVERANSPRPGFDCATLSVRTLAEIERRYETGEAWSIPRPSTVRTLAACFELEPGTPEWERFVAASRAPEDIVLRPSRTPHPDPIHPADPWLDIAIRTLESIREELIATVDEVLARCRDDLLAELRQPGDGREALPSWRLAEVVPDNPSGREPLKPMREGEPWPSS